jgi:hypothetical protein
MIVKQISKNIYLIKFKTRNDLTSTLLRFQEHYESPKFKGKIFTLEEYKKWYIKNSPKGIKTGKFTYYKDWSGFNIPSHILQPFYRGLFNPLTEAEKSILHVFNKIRNKKFYIIGVYGDVDKSILKHEIAHGMYYSNNNYHKEVNAVLKKMDSIAVKQIIKYFKKNAGYHKDVYLDEIHAYTLTEKGLLKKRGVDVHRILNTRKELLQLFKKYSSR